MTAGSLSELFVQINAGIDNALNHEVATFVKSAQSDAVDKTVYDVYAPKMYDRRGENGGLGDERNMIASVSNGVLEVVNAARPNEKYPLDSATPHPAISSLGISLAEAVVRGVGYDFTGGPYEQPRDFIGKTRDNLSSNSKLRTAVKTGLKRMNIRST